MKRQNREELLAIKSGKFEYDELLRMADMLMTEIEEAYQTSALPPVPDREKLVAILVAMRKELYQ